MTSKFATILHILEMFRYIQGNVLDIFKEKAWDASKQDIKILTCSHGNLGVLQILKVQLVTSISVIPFKNIYFSTYPKMKTLCCYWMFYTIFFKNNDLHDFSNVTPFLTVFQRNKKNLCYIVNV